MTTANDATSNANDAAAQDDTKAAAKPRKAKEKVDPMSDIAWVRVNRPENNKDHGIMLGFNGVQAFFPFGCPVKMPRPMFEYHSTQTRAVTTPGEDGAPETFYVPHISIIEVAAPEGVE